MRKSSSGFTIIEVLIVVAVIGILTTISLISFTRYQADSRDTQRSSRATIIAEALEKYYDENGEYPSCTAMTDTGLNITTNVLPDLDQQVLITPKAESNQTNSIDLCTTLSPTSTTDSFAYIGDGSAACSTGSSCLQFSLQYIEESTGEVKTIESRRQTAATTLREITNLTASAINFSQINLSWTSVENATSYTVERATNSGFTSPTTLPAATTNSYASTGLTAGTQYWYRVTPVASSGDALVSNVASATTPALSTPVCTVTANGPSQIDVTWTSVPLASSYTLRHATNSGFTTGLVTIGSLPTSPLSYSITGLTAGDTKYVQVRAGASGDTGDYCAYQSATTAVPAPATITATTNSSSQITASWASVSVATSYTLQYSLSNTFSSPTTITGLTGTSRVNTGLNHGRTYYFRVYALVGATSSVASSTASATTTVSAPSTPSVSVAMGGIRAYSSGRWIYWDSSPSSGNWYYAQGSASTSCSGGATPQYLMGANYNSPSTFRGWTGWDSNSTYFMVRPYSGYTIRFTSIARCVSSQGVVSSNSGQGYSGYLGP